MIKFALKMDNIAEKWKDVLTENQYSFRIKNRFGYFKFKHFRNFFLKKIIKLARKNNAKKFLISELEVVRTLYLWHILDLK